MPTKTIVILANSHKHGGRCVAGKEVMATSENRWKLCDKWYRPVSSDKESHGAIPLSQTYDRGTRKYFRALDIVEIHFLEPVPEHGQPENWSFVENKPWSKLGHFKSTVATRLLDDPEDIWADPRASNISLVSAEYTDAGKVDQSLVLIQPEDLRLHLTNNHNPWQGKFSKDMRASFSYKGVNYEGIRVTDTIVWDEYKNSYPEQDAPPNVVTLAGGDRYSLCISLAPPFSDNNNTQSKLVAAIIPQS